MRKLFVKNATQILRLTGDEHKHLSLVLRARVGDAVMVSTGDGFDYSYRVESISKTETGLKLFDKKMNETEPHIELTLFTAILKGDKNELVTRMCTELGVVRFVPMTTEYTTAAVQSYKTERMRKIALESAKQSGRGCVPEICEPIVFSDMTDLLCEFDLVVFPYENAKDCDIRSFLQNESLKEGRISRVATIVGSEGGFSEQEVAALIQKGAVPLTLGKRILRADTACAAVCALILYEAGEMK